MYKFKLTLFSEIHLNNFIKLSKTEYPSENSVTNKKFIKWKHLMSPLGASYIYQLLHDDKIVGRIMYEKKIIQLGQKKYKIINPSDLLIKKKYRNPASNFLTLISGPKFFFNNSIVLHTGNKKSLPLYKNLLKLPTIFSLSFYLFPINPLCIIRSKFFKRLVYPVFFLLNFLISYTFKFILIFSSLRFKEITHGQNEFSAIKKIIINKNIPFFYRDNNLLKWRYSIYDKKDISIFNILYKNNVIGYFSVLKKNYMNLKCSIILDFIISPSLPFFKKLAIRIFLICNAIASKSDLIFFMANNKSSLSKVLVGAPFIKMHDNFLPHASPFFIRKNNLISTEKFSSTHITLFDIDYF